MKKEFGKINDVQHYLYTVENNFMKVSVSDYGACLVDFIDKRSNTNIVKGFDSVEAYEEIDSYMGMSVGRVCNRIAEGKFRLNDVEYSLYVNNGPNSLHGGKYGLSFRKWDVHIEDNIIICKVFSKDNEEGYPGNLEVTVKYILDGNSLIYQYSGTSDKDTILSITNHAYFNLNGRDSDTIANHSLKLKSDRVAVVDENGMATKEAMSVEGTPFDFREFKTIGEALESDHPQIRIANGLDHHYITDDDQQPIIECYGSKCGMKIYSDLPGVQIYTANFLPVKQSAVCFETQFYPNAINYDNRFKPVLKAGHVVRYKTKFIVSEVKK